MSRTNRKPTFSKVKAVKQNARDRIGMPKASFALPEKTKKKEKHKPTLSTLLSDDFNT